MSIYDITVKDKKGSNGKVKAFCPDSDYSAFIDFTVQRAIII